MGRPRLALAAIGLLILAVLGSVTAPAAAQIPVGEAPPEDQGSPVTPEDTGEDVSPFVPLFDLEAEELLQPDPQAQLLEQLVMGDLADLSTDPGAFDEDMWAYAVRDALSRRKYVRARELTRQILDRDPDSFVGHCLMGIVFHRAEGNLPRAYFHMGRSRELFEGRFGAMPQESDPWPWHAQSILGLAIIAGEMGRHEEKIELLLEHDQLYSPPTVADRGWPLMRLRRYEEARRAVTEALQLEDEDQVAHAMTALCAIEAELQNREASYQACKDAAAYERERDFIGPTPFTNAAEAGLGMLQFAEAESHILEGASHFVDGTVSNPWLDLTQLYLSQGRVTEALDAVREMFKWRLRQPPYMDEQNRAETEMTSAIFLLVAGHPLEAARIVGRAMARPDRTGFTSSESEQLEAASALVDSVVHRVAAAMASEDAAAASWRDGLSLRWAALDHLRRSWSSGRRAASLLAEDRFLLSTLRPYLAGGIELPEWLKIELVGLLGSGVVEVALGTVESQETLPEAEAYFQGLRAEASCINGRWQRCLEEAEAARQSLPGAELLLRARISARAAGAALKLGQRRLALELLDETMQIDPGVMRRVGLALPTRFEVAGNDAATSAAAVALQASPRFKKDSEDGAFAVRVEGGEGRTQACLIGPRGTRLACAQVRQRAGEKPVDIGRRAAAELQREAFAPRLDLTQADLRSLDGSPTAAGGRSHQKLRQVLKDVTGDS